MDGGAHGGGNGGGGGGPAPFLLKTYEMVDDASTDDIVSWSSTNASFVVWNPPDFSARLLPTYFKHSNFSSFIRQLNTYGFRKIDPERWEFANDEFIKGQKHLLKNIHRRKPIHSHSNPPGGGLADVERAALEDEIERLNREKNDLKANLWRFRQQLSGTENQMEDLERRLADMEQRQLKIVAFMQRALHKPQLMENLLRMAEASPVDLSAIHKKRRLPADMNYIQEASVNSSDTDPCTSDKPHIGYALDKDFCSKLTLELNSAIPDDELVTTGTQINDGNGGGLQTEQNDFDHELTGCLPLVPETSQICGAGAPICATDEGIFVRGSNGGGGLFPSHLSLTLSWPAVQNDTKTADLVDQGEANAVGLQTSPTSKDNDLSISVRANQSTLADDSELNALPPREAVPNNDDPQGVNDMFWQQFLTERPGC